MQLHQNQSASLLQKNLQHLLKKQKPKTAAPVKIQKDHSEDDKASKIAAALFGDESAASQAPAPAENPEAASAPQGDQTGQDPNAGQSNQHAQGGEHPWTKRTWSRTTPAPK